MDEDEELNENTSSQNNETSSSNNFAQKTAQKSMEKAKKQVTKKASKTVAKAAKAGSKMASLGPILIYVIIAIIIIIVFVGVVMFLVTMPGMVMEKIKALFKEIGNRWLSWWGQDTAKQIEDKEIYGVLDYLEQMGYDLKGYGFLTDYVGKSDDGVERDSDSDTISNAESDFIFTYIVSENYLYTIKNNNVTTSWWKAPWEHLSALWSDNLDNRKGMLAIYHEDNGKIGSAKENAYDAWERGSITANAETKTLEIKRGWFTNTMTYNLDGWTGRYGKPIDFLLSLHIATMMPDLAYDIASNFPTEIYLILHKVNDSEVIASYKTNTGEYVDYPTIEKALTGNEARHWYSKVWDWFDNLNINTDEANNVFNLGIEHAEDCDCEFDNDKVKTIGNNCKNHIKEILDNLKDTNDYSFDTYTPYISKVVNHWFRDVYFVADDPKLSFVTNDVEYEALMKERWTLYETYSSDDSDKGTYKYNLEKAGEYILYEIDEAGNYKTSGDGKKGYEGHIIYEGSQEEAKNENIKVVKQAVTKKLDDIVEDANWNNIKGTWAAYNFEDTQTAMERVFSDEDAEDNEIKKRIYYQMTTGGNVVQTGEGQRTETNPEIKKMFLNNTYFRYDGSKETAEAITKLRNDNNLKFGALNDKKVQGKSLDTILKLKTTIGEGENKKEFSVSDVSGQVNLNQDSLNAFSMLENEHTLDADYIYRDFKELIVELGYFTKEELTDETPRLLQFIVPEIGSYGYPERSIDKRENEYGTMVHSKYDIDANNKYTLKNLLADTINDSITNEKAENDTTVNETVNGITSNENLENALNGIRARAENGQDFISLGSIENSTTSLLSLDEWWEENQKIFDIYKAEGWLYDGHEGPGGSLSGTGQSNGCNAGTSFDQVHNNSSSEKSTDCSIGTSWLLQKLGALGEGHTFTSYMGDSGTLNQSDICAQELLDAGAEVIVPPDGTNFASAATSGQLEPGDILFYSGHVSLYCGESYKDCSATYCWDTGSTSQIQAGGPVDKSSETRPIKLILRLPISNTPKSEGNPYEGFKGNEAVVSPVTGILLEYGTYDENDKSSVTGEEYRENVDLKYGSAIKTTSEDDEQNIVADKVGYAKILVLNDEAYQILESNTKNSWKADSLRKETGGYFEKLKKTQNELDDQLKNMSQIDKTVYGYKEFVENYEKFGIAGNIVYIDGFKTELPDESFGSSEDEDTDTLTSETEGIPKGEELKLSSFKVKENQLEDENELIQSLYKKAEEYKTVSEEINVKLNGESQIKDEASPALSVDKKIKVNDKKYDAIFIKEGTVLGRTYTDKELVENVRNEKFEDYKGAVKTDGESASEDMNTDRVIGNYLRIIMRDKDDTVIENVEDYMKLDDGSKNDLNGVYEDLEKIDENSTDAEKVRAAVSYFVEQGFTVEAACGILGNLIQESSLDPNAVNSSYLYHGLAQWDPDIRWVTVKEWMASQGYNEDSFAGQIRAIYECEKNQMDESRWEELKGLTDSEKAAELFLVYFERGIGGSDPTVWYDPGVCYQNTNNRKKFSHNAYDIYMGDDSKGIKD